MKNEGFTLVELLAVILILAFIAIIAVPIVLNIITEAKIKSLKISTSEYIRAVNTSLINEEVFNNVKDGLYTITDNGKKIVLGDKEIFINYDGRGLKSGLLLIENSKVKRVLKGLIDDYYARVTDEDIEILKNLNESTLVDGLTFNANIKTLVGDELGDKTYFRDVVDTKVKKIIFLQDSVLPESLTKEDLENFKHIKVSTDKSEYETNAYYDEVNQAIYVYSDGYISCPTDLRWIFSNFQGIEEIELNLIDTSKVTNMISMFQDCNLLKDINLIGINTSNVTDFGSMFRGCSGLTELDLSNFNTNSARSIGGMFSNCSSLEELNLSNFNTTQVTNMGGAWDTGVFSGCTNLKKIILGEKFDTSKATDMHRMFESCTNLKEIKGLENFDTHLVTNMYNMFYGCNSLTNLDLSKWNTSKVLSMEAMFRNCINLKEIKGIENFSTSEVTRMDSMFYNCSSLTKLDVSHFDTSRVENMSSMFEGCSSLTILDTSSFDTSSVKNMWAMFRNCSSLKEIKGIENFNTSKVENMCGMFNSCSSLEYLDLSKWDTRNVTGINHFNTGGSIFQNCTNLKSIKFGENCTFEKVIYMTSMFNGCTNLSEIVGLEYFNTSIAIEMGGMFYNCSSLTKLDVSHFDTSKVTFMRNMFSNCTSLTELDLRSFDTHSATDYGMFWGCTNLSVVKVTTGKWNLPDSLLSGTKAKEYTYFDL